MIEIVFSESAGGCLKYAQTFGAGAYPGSGVIGFVCSDDLTEAERVEAFLAAGLLEPVTQPAKSDPLYHRLLRKIK